MAAVMSQYPERLPRPGAPRGGDDRRSASPEVLTLEQVASWGGPPLILFAGVSTGGSFVHTVFGGWAAVLGRPWRLRGIDLPPSTQPETYRQLLSAMRHNPAVHGAVITAHKLRLYRACAADLDRCDRLTDLTHEINTLASGSTIAGYARDALSLTHVIPTLASRSTARTLSGLHVLCIGAGGAATALLLALHLDIDADSDAADPVIPRADQPARVIFADTSPRALDDLRSVAARALISTGHLSFAQVRGAGDCDTLVAELPSPGLLVNATGLGKDRPGSPITGRAPLGPATLAWDLNYRGTLTFLRHAAARGAPVMNGWDYFVAGWAGALTAIAGVPFTSGLLAQFTEAAAPHRPAPGRNSGEPPPCPGR
jgi:shikimate dehydrogenase